MGKEDRRRLQQHIRMAEQAGADISTIYGDDIPQQIAEFARISGITKIVLGRSSVHRRHFWSGPSLTEKLTLTAPNLDIYIIRMLLQRPAMTPEESCSPVRFCLLSVIC